jgi:multiple sugar transport system ATP-binding protein
MALFKQVARAGNFRPAIDMFVTRHRLRTGQSIAAIQDGCVAYLVIERLTRIFERPNGDELRAVDDLCLSVEEKEMLVLVGPSGCGKTTTLRLIAGLDKPTGGSILLEGRSQLDLPPQDRNLAMIFQHHALYPHLSAGENIAFGLKLRRLPRTEIDKRVGEASEMLDLNGCLGRKPAELSGGEQQRVAIARALVRRPKVFLFDEPLSHLDAQLRARMRREIRSLQRRIGAAMIYVTHDQVEAMAMGDRIAVMDRGVLQQVGVPRAVYQNPANLFTAQFIGSPPMNMLHGRLREEHGGLVFQGPAINGAGPESLSIQLHGQVADTIGSFAGKELVLGIRAEHVLVSQVKSDIQRNGTIEGYVDFIETNGVDSYVYLTNRKAKLVARFEGECPPTIGEKMNVEFNLNLARFFDPQSGKLIT